MSYHRASEVHRGPGAVAAVDAVSPRRRRARQMKARASAVRDRRLAQIVTNPRGPMGDDLGQGVVCSNGTVAPTFDMCPKTASPLMRTGMTAPRLPTGTVTATTPVIGVRRVLSPLTTTVAPTFGRGTTVTSSPMIPKVPLTPRTGMVVRPMPGATYGGGGSSSPVTSPGTSTDPTAGSGGGGGGTSAPSSSPGGGGYSGGGGGGGYGGGGSSSDPGSSSGPLLTPPDPLPPDDLTSSSSGPLAFLSAMSTTEKVALAGGAAAALYFLFGRKR